MTGERVGGNRPGYCDLRPATRDIDLRMARAKSSRGHVDVERDMIELPISGVQVDLDVVLAGTRRA